MKGRWTDEELDHALRLLATQGRRPTAPAVLRRYPADVVARPMHRPWLAWPGSWRSERRLLVALAVAGLLLALSAGTLLVGSNLLERFQQLLHDPSALTPSGIEVVTPDTGVYDRVVSDGDGNLWAEGAGRLVRYTPATRTARTWTVSDDLRFAAGGVSNITPARAGGVWLIGERTLRRFDGTGFRESVDVGATIAAAVEAPDHSLWAATWDGYLVHVVGAALTRISDAPLHSPSDVSAIAVDDAGRVWCGWWLESEGGIESGWLSRYDGSGWVNLTDSASARLVGGIRSITVLPDGSMIVTSSLGATRLRDDSWTDLSASRTADSAAMAPDGSLWIARADLTDGPVTVEHLIGQSSTPFGPADGLPGAGQPIAMPSIAVTKDGVFVGTSSGIYELGAGRWGRVWPATIQPGLEQVVVAGEQSWGSSEVTFSSVVAVSRDEAWAPRWKTFWHFSNGSWTALQAPDSRVAKNLLPTADGTLWAIVRSADGGVGAAFELQGNQWVQMASAPTALGADASGTVWVAGADGASPAGTIVRSFAFDGQTWSERFSTTPTALVTGCLSGVAVGGDRSVWLGSSGGGCFPWQPGQPGLARYRNGSWELVRPSGASATVAIRDLVTAPDGSVWALGWDPSVASGSSTLGRRTWVARFDGTAWTVFDAHDGLADVVDIALAPDGAVWATTFDGLARLDGTAWTSVVHGLPLHSIDVAPDGTVWVTGDFGVARIAASLTRR
ncbi:MAG: hypothetical protein ACXWXR_08795 [Candidatus Limnocylindrales bacterium]